ncbi:hypothetical protein ACU635_34810 [[Actinomadura] parvosata]|uniref:hypothetical protein n=1 Tax=[Actinomadura] parvosata TaxID=1955412 RepID=UPI00406C844E
MIIAVSTSVPELVVTALCGARGQDELAIAAVVKSNVMNMTLVLGIGGLIGALTTDHPPCGKGAAAADGPRGGTNRRGLGGRVSGRVPARGGRRWCHRRRDHSSGTGDGTDRRGHHGRRQRECRHSPRHRRPPQSQSVSPAVAAYGLLLLYI